MDEEMIDDVIVEEPIVEKPVKAKKEKPQTSDFIRAENGDSYLSIAVRYCGDANPNEYARYLSVLNNGAVVRKGAKIFLKEIR